jgi:hypothetical protein
MGHGAMGCLAQGPWAMGHGPQSMGHGPGPAWALGPSNVTTSCMADAFTGIAFSDN